MKSWLIAGPFSVSPGGHPRAAVQEKAFKENGASKIAVTDGHAIPAIITTIKRLGGRR